MLRIEAIRIRDRRLVSRQSLMVPASVIVMA